MNKSRRSVLCRLAIRRAFRHIAVMTKQTIMPVFVLGIQRSGTTGMANALAGHPALAAVEAGDHHGVHESIVFSHFARAFDDLNSAETRKRFLEAFTTCDYFLLSGLSPGAFSARPFTTCAEAFRILMDEIARRQGASGWIEKTPNHTLCADALARDFPDARFVGMIRKPTDLIASRLWMDGQVPPPYPRRAAVLFRMSAASSLYQRSLRDFAGRCDRARLVEFESFKADPESVLREVAVFLDLDFHPVLLERRYAPNTSFAQSAGRLRLTAIDRLCIAFSTVLFGAVPLAALRRQEAARRRKEGVVWPDWCWKRNPQSRIA